MANDKSFKVKNGLLAGRYYGNNGTETAGSNGPYGTFSTDLYTGNGSTQTITNNIDLAGDGGLVWVKSRTSGASHILSDTERGSNNGLASDLTNGTLPSSYGQISGFNSSGFSVNYPQLYAGETNASGDNYVAWTFKQASNFFDVVTYTGNSTARTISHNLGTTVGTIFVKNLTDTDNWIVFHRSTGETKYLELDNTSIANTYDMWDNTAPTSTEFSLSSYQKVNETGHNYVAYLFAHDTSDDGYIQCGSYTGNNTTGNSVTLGWEPSWLLIKNATTGGTNDDGWWIVDKVRGLTDLASTGDKTLQANTSAVEDTYSRIGTTSTGFELTNGGEFNQSGDTYIYIAIRAVVQTQTLDLSTGHTFSITPTEALDILFSNPPASGTATGFSVEVNNSAGGYALTWPSSVKWDLGTAPTATASKEVYTFITTDGGTTYYGKKAAGDIA